MLGDTEERVREEEQVQAERHRDQHPEEPGGRTVVQPEGFDGSRVHCCSPLTCGDVDAAYAPAAR
ncbi:hypothetical protein GCM10010413_42530 [Promicromonospora sukumoe]